MRIHWYGTSLGMLLASLQDTGSYAQFEMTYGGTTDDGANAVKQTPDGGYLIGGASPWGGAQQKACLVKTDFYGNLMWSWTLSGSYNETFQSVELTNDGGYIAAGWSASFGAGQVDAVLMKMDAAGNPQWTRTYGGFFWDRANTVRATSDGGYILCGWTYSSGAGSSDVYLVKTDALGNLTWARTYGGAVDERGAGVQQTTDGGYIVCGWTTSFGAGDFDVYLIKVDPSGSVQWSWTYGGPGLDVMGRVVQTPDRGYLLVGQTASFGSGVSDVYLIKTDSVGVLLWSRTYGGAGYEAGSSLEVTSDGGCVIAGRTSSYGAGGSDGYLLKMDPSGALQWSRAYGGTGFDWLEPVGLTANGGLIAAGYTTSYGSGGDFYLVNTDATGYSGGNGCQQEAATITTIPPTQSAVPPTVALSSGTTQTSPTPATFLGGTATVVCPPPPTLPIVLLSFTSTCSLDGVDLQWSTASEQNCASFVVEGSGDGLSFSTVGTVPCAGGTHTTLYSMHEHAPLAGTRYYRLIEHDFNGETTYSDVIALACPMSDIAINVNFDASRLTVLLFQDRSTTADLSLFNGSGMLVTFRTLSHGANDIDISSFPPGVFLYRLISDGQVVRNGKFIID